MVNRARLRTSTHSVLTYFVSVHWHEFCPCFLAVGWQWRIVGQNEAMEQLHIEGREGGVRLRCFRMRYPWGRGSITLGLRSVRHLLAGIMTLFASSNAIATRGSRLFAFDMSSLPDGLVLILQGEKIPICSRRAYLAPRTAILVLGMPLALLGRWRRCMLRHRDD